MSILNGRVAVVTGASSGIGEACAIALVERGANVVLAARRMDRLTALVEKIEALGGQALAVATDVTDEAAVQNLFDSAVERFGTVDLLINNAGIADSTPIEDTDMDLWYHVINTNLTSAFLCTRAAIRIMRDKGHGRILNVGSISARVPRAESPAYSATKWGMEGMARSVAIDNRNRNIAVSVFHPGIVATELGAGMKSMPEHLTAEPSVIADAMMAMVDLPDHLNFLEGIVVQNGIPFLGRG